MQVAAAGVVNVAVSVGIPAVLGLQVWVVQKISKFESKFTRFDTWAFGPTGNNGINGRVSKLESDVEDIRDKEREPR